MGTKLKRKPKIIDLEKIDLQEKIEQISSYIDDVIGELIKDEYDHSLEINEDLGPSHKAIITHDLKNDALVLDIKMILFEMYYDMKLEMSEIKKMLAQLLHDRE